MSSAAVGHQAPRALFVVESHAFGGAEGYVCHLIAGLASRYRTALLGVGTTPEPLRTGAAAAGAELHQVAAPRGKLDVPGLWRLAGAIRAAAPDIVHVNLPDVTTNRHALGVAVALRLPTVATLCVPGPVGAGVQHRVLRAAFGRLPAVIAMSQEIADQLVDGLGVRRDRVRVVPNGVPDRGVPDRGVERPAAGRAVRIGSLGRLADQKGYDVLIEATRLLAARGRPIEVVIGGDGPDREALRAQAAGLPVTFAGFVHDTDAFLRSVDVFCLPSRWEGLPFALLEAMMAGLPCVTTDVGDVVEAVGDAAVVVAPGDACALADELERLVGSDRTRATLGDRARRRARDRFSVERMVVTTAAIFEHVLDR